MTRSGSCGVRVNRTCRNSYTNRPMFRPNGKVVTHAELQRLEEPPLHINPHLDLPPGVDLVERSLTCLFLRRYVTYCARRKWYARMQGAVKLHREIEKKASAYRSDAVIKSEKGPTDDNGPCRKNY